MSQTETSSDRIERDVVIEAPIETTWRIVTEPMYVSQWFCDKAEIDPRPGGKGFLHWDEHGTSPLQVVAFEPSTYFAFRWVFPEGEEPRHGNSVLVEFTLTQVGDQTHLHLVESGFEATLWPAAEKIKFRTEHEAGWDELLGKLVAYDAKSQVPVRY